jgi:hypothetical protein
MSRQLQIASHIKIFGAENKSAYVAKLYRDGAYATGLGVLNTDNMFVSIKQFSSPIKVSSLKNEKTAHHIIAELQPLSDAFRDQKKPEVVYYVGNCDAKTAVMETLGLPLSIIVPLVQQCKNERNTCMCKKSWSH